LQPNARRGKSESAFYRRDILENWRRSIRLPEKIIEYREFAKLKSTYVDALSGS